MSLSALQQSIPHGNSQPKLKQLHSLSTLTNNKTPSPPLLHKNINLSRFKSIDVTEKAKKKLKSNNLKGEREGNYMKGSRNHSLGSMMIKDGMNPENEEGRLNGTSKKEADSDFIGLNKELTRQTKAKNFLNKLFGSDKADNSTYNPSHRPQKLDMTLPVISHKKPLSKRSNFLQQWLDEALDPQQLSLSDMKQLSKRQNGLLSSRTQLQQQLPPKSNYLSTVKKYQIDRTYLRSQNIPQEIIQRLYNTLFIYTHGISNVFDELLGFVKTEPGEEVRDSKILSNFWKCFVKLLEGCTSFQTSFQKVQEQYVGRVNELKELLVRKESEFMKQREDFNQTVIKFEKERVEAMNTYSKLQSDHKIAVSTLELTDHAFNEEVQLRLKFEQKINHIYSSYEQLRAKYQAIMGTLQTKNQESFQKASLQVKLKQKIRQLQGSLQQHKDLLAKQKSKVYQRELQVSIKRQQLLDLQMNLQLKQQKQQQQQDVVQTELNKNALLKTKADELQNRVKLMGFTNEGLVKKLHDQKMLVEAYRKLNEGLHQKCNQVSQKLVEYEAHKIYQSAEIFKLSTELTMTKQQLSIVSEQKSFLQSKITLTFQQLHQAQYQIQTKTSAIQNINSTIQDLKAIKNKYEILWKIMQKQKSDLQNQRNLIHQKYQLEKEQFIGLKMLHENREKYIKDIQSKHDKEKDLLKRKITGYNQIVTKKESLILNFQKNQEEKNDLLLKKNYRIEQLEKQLTDQKAITTRKAKDSEFLARRVEDLEKVVKSTEEKLKSRGHQLEKKLTEFDITSQELSSVKALLSLIKEQQNSSISNFTKLFESYRELVIRKGQHIHPMLYEDLTQQFNRAKLEVIPKLDGKILELKEVKEKMEREIQKLNEVITAKDCEINGLCESLVTEKGIVAQKVEQISQLKKQVITLQKTIKQQSIQLTNSYKTITEKEQKINELASTLQTVTDNLSLSRSSLTAKQVEIQRLTASISQLSQKLCSYEAEMQQKQKHNPYLIKIEKLEKELGEVRKELNGLRGTVREEREVQTEPEGEVVILEPKYQNSSLRKNKFFINQTISKTDSKQVQVCLPPYDSIPEYIDTKIQQIKRQQLNREEKNESKISYVMKSKSKDSPEQIPLSKEKSLTNLEGNASKEPITRREELRRALRFTYMRR